MFLAFLEFLGTTELLVILFAALVLFGPRKLPQMSRQLGRSLTEFKRASEDFKRTWEKEVEIEKLEEEGRSMRSMLSDDLDEPATTGTGERRGASDTAPAEEVWTQAETPQPTVARAPSNQRATEEEEGDRAQLPTEAAAPAAPEPSAKRDWL